jgi:uncharacterized protein YerC
MRPREIDRAKVAKLVSQGLTNPQIAERLGCKVPAIVRVKADLGLTDQKFNGAKARMTTRVA